MGEVKKPTRREIAAAKTANGGWTKAQLAQWGVPWPPPKGWKKRLERESDEAAQAVNSFKRETEEAWQRW